MGQLEQLLTQQQSHHAHSWFGTLEEVKYQAVVALVYDMFQNTINACMCIRALYINVIVPNEVIVLICRTPCAAGACLFSLLRSLHKSLRMSSKYVPIYIQGCCTVERHSGGHSTNFVTHTPRLRASSTPTQDLNGFKIDASQSSEVAARNTPGCFFWECRHTQSEEPLNSGRLAEDTGHQI